MLVKFGSIKGELDINLCYLTVLGCFNGVSTKKLWLISSRGVYTTHINIDTTQIPFKIVFTQNMYILEEKQKKIHFNTHVIYHNYY